MSSERHLQELGAIRRQPRNDEILHLDDFRLVCWRTPKMVYHCQEVDLPGLSLNSVRQPAPFATAIKHAGNLISFEPLKVRFQVQQNLENYMELRNWVKLLANERNIGDEGTEKDKYSDITVILANSKSRGFFAYHFLRAFPISVGGLILSTTNRDVEYAQAEVIFDYSGYEYEFINENVRDPIET